MESRPSRLKVDFCIEDLFLDLKGLFRTVEVSSGLKGKIVYVCVWIC